jgi:hypothetical protein
MRPPLATGMFSHATEEESVNHSRAVAVRATDGALRCACGIRWATPGDSANRMCEFGGQSGAGQEGVDRVEVGVTENVAALEFESGGARDRSEQVLGVRSRAQHVVSPGRTRR